MSRPAVLPAVERLLYSVPEAAGLLNCSTTSIYELIQIGSLKAVRMGRNHRITRAALEAFIAQLEAEREDEDEKTRALLARKWKKAWNEEDPSPLRRMRG